MTEELADAWIAASEAKAAQDGFERGSAYWDAGSAWIAAPEHAARSGLMRMTSRPPSTALVLVLLVIAVVYFFWNSFTHVPQEERPSVDAVTTRCVRPDHEPVGDGYGQPCPPGTTPDTVVIRSFLPTPQP